MKPWTMTRRALLIAVAAAGLAGGCQTTCDEYTTDYTRGDTDSAGPSASGAGLTRQAEHPCRTSFLPPG